MSRAGMAEFHQIVELDEGALRAQRHRRIPDHGDVGGLPAVIAASRPERTRCLADATYRFLCTQAAFFCKECRSPN